MALPVLLILLAVFTIAASMLVFLRNKLLHAVIFLATCSLGSALIFLYLGQVLVALLQLLVFVGGLATYLIVAVAAEEKKLIKLASKVRFVFAAIVIALVLLIFLPLPPNPQNAGNDFSAVAEAGFSSYYIILFAAVLLLFAVGIGSVLIIKKSSKLVV